MDQQECPCKYIIQLEERHNGEINLLKQEMNFQKQTFDNEIKGVLNDFKEMTLQVKECLLSMQSSAELFKNGNFRFSKIEKDVGEIKNEMGAVEKAIGDKPAYFIGRWMSRRRYAWAWAIVVTLAIISSGYLAETLKLVKLFWA